MDQVVLDPALISKILGDSTLVGVLFLIVKSLWASKQEGDKALIDYLQSSKRDDLAAQQKQIESNDRLTDMLGELKESIDKRNADDDHRYAESERRLCDLERQMALQPQPGRRSTKS